VPHFPMSGNSQFYSTGIDYAKMSCNWFFYFLMHNNTRHWYLC